jgi:hypothetical protein
MTDLERSKANRRVARELGNLTDHQQHIFAWVAENHGWKPGSRWGNYSSPSGTLRDVQAVAKKGHLVLDESGTYIVPDAIKARIADLTAEFRAESKAKDEARMAAYNARRFVVVIINTSTGQSNTYGGIYTGPEGSDRAYRAAGDWRATPAGLAGGEMVNVIELPATS